MSLSEHKLGGKMAAPPVRSVSRLPFSSLVHLKLRAIKIHNRFGYNLLASRKAGGKADMVKPSDKAKPSTKPSGRNNISKIRDSSFHGFGPSDQIYYKPKVSENFLENWLDFPVDRKVFTYLNTCKMFLTWLLWNNKGMAGLDPNDPTIRSRICQHISILGTAAGLFLVVAIAGFLVPPPVHRDEDIFWLNIFGILMFTSSCCLIYYIALTLTVFYPLVESLRDDIAFDAYEQYQRRVGGYESYMFYIGLQLVAAAMLVAAKILYSDAAVLIMCVIMVVTIIAVAIFAKEIFISLDPISAMHMGLTNDRDIQFRAELLSHFMLRKIPNSIVDEDEDPHQDVFEKRRESVKLQGTRSSARYLPTTHVPQKYSASQHIRPQQASEKAESVTQRPFHITDHGDGDDEEEEDTNGEFLPSGGRYKAPVIPAPAARKITLCATRIPFEVRMTEDDDDDLSQKSVVEQYPLHLLLDENRVREFEPVEEVEVAKTAAGNNANNNNKGVFNSNLQGVGTVFTSKGTRAVIFTSKGAHKRGTYAIPSMNKAKVVPVTSMPSSDNMRRSFLQQQQQQPPQGMPLASRRSFLQQQMASAPPITRRSIAQSIDLKDMFLGDAYIFQVQGLAAADSEAAYKAITSAGCTSSQDLLDFLNTHRQQATCSCGRAKKGSSMRGGNAFTHANDCDTRMAGLWANSLVKMGIPAFHAMKIIECLKKDLK